MVKKVVHKEVTSLHFDGDKLDSVIEELTRLRASYGETATIDKEHYEYGDGEYWCVKADRLETDAEEAKREANEARWQQQREESDRRQYEALKKKFGAE